MICGGTVGPTNPEGTGTPPGEVVVVNDGVRGYSFAGSGERAMEEGSGGCGAGLGVSLVSVSMNSVPSTSESPARSATANTASFML